MIIDLDGDLNAVARQLVNEPNGFLKVVALCYETALAEERWIMGHEDNPELMKSALRNHHKAVVKLRKLRNDLMPLYRIATEAPQGGVS